jgi:glyoxylase-like metal-dependent hydrolase (beta-lactamase superfamily II)
MYKISGRVLGPVATNCYTVVNEETKESILIDAADRHSSKLLAATNDAGAKPVALLLTHAHFDHTDGIPAVRTECPDIEVIIGENDAPLLEDPRLNLSIMFMGEPFTAKADRTVADGDEIELIGLKIKCIEVPGHTVGGMCYYIPELGVVFDGDTLFCGSVGRSDFPTGDGDLLIKSIREKLFVLPDDTKVMPGHDAQTTIHTEKVGNFYFD